MPRPPDPRIRARLCDQAVDYVLSHGIGDVALRPLGKALNTNARMLVYHFGSREGLMREILFGIRKREDARIRAWFKRGKSSRTLSDFLRWYWERMSSPDAEPLVRLVFELYALALRHPQEHPGVLEDPLVYWEKLTKNTGSKAKPSQVEATLLLAATRGLLLDLCASGDRARARNALRFLVRLLESRDRRSVSSRRRQQGRI